MKDLDPVTVDPRQKRSVTWLALSLSLGYLALMATLMWMFEHAITLSEISDALDNPGRLKSWSIIGLTAVAIFLVSQWALQRISRPLERPQRLADAGADALQTLQPEDGGGSWRDAALLLGLVAALLVSTGSFVVLEQQAALDGARYRQFAVIGKMKANTASRWVDERQRDMRVLLEDDGFVADLKRWIKEANRSATLRDALVSELQAVVEGNGFDGMTVVTPNGKRSLAVPDTLMARKACAAAALEAPGESARDIRMSFAFAGSNESPKLDVIGQVLDPDRPDKRHFATLCLRLDLNQRLLPAISQWPGDARSGEILIGRAEGDDVIVINSAVAGVAEHRASRMKNAHAVWQAAQEATKAHRVTEDALADGSRRVMLVFPVANSPWMLMVRMNRDEADQLQSRNESYGTIGIGFLLLFVVTAFAIAWARSSSARSRAQSQRDQLLVELHALAYYDELTGLPGRRLITDRLEVALRDAQRRTDSLTVIFLDLDGFKSINDTYGHAAGDEVLRVVAERLRDVLRRNDSAGRLGGDEYLVLVTGNMDASATSVIRDKISQTVTKPVDWNGQALQVGVSLGMAVYPTDGTSAQELMAKADAAMYADKATRR